MKKGDFALLILVILLIWFLSTQFKKMTNSDKLNSLHSAVRNDFINFVHEVEALGYEVIITDATRSFAESARLKKKDSRNASPGYSSHNYGMALDIVLRDKKGNLIQKNSPRSVWINTGVPALAINKYGMRWGGNFFGYPDHVHFDYQNKYPTKKLLALGLKQFGSLDKIVGNEVNLI